MKTTAKETKMSKRTAKIALSENLQRARLAAAMIMDSLNELEQEAAGKENWGDVGTAHEILNQLTETLGFSKGLEAKDAAEVIEDILADQAAPEGN